jgi:hypothetical protein
VNIVEKCGCGATCEASGNFPEVATAVNQFRDAHADCRKKANGPK